MFWKFLIFVRVRAIDVFHFRLYKWYWRWLVLISHLLLPLYNLFFMILVSPASYQILVYNHGFDTCHNYNFVPFWECKLLCLYFFHILILLQSLNLWSWILLLAVLLDYLIKPNWHFYIEVWFGCKIELCFFQFHNFSSIWIFTIIRVKIKMKKHA